MKIIRYILLSIAIFSLLPCKAQHEIEIDWSAYAQDTVMPVFVHSVDLGYDCAGAYSATIEYPELKPLTMAEVERFRLPQKEGAPEWPAVETYKGVSAKRGQLDVSFSPVIWRDGGYWRVQSFTLKVHREALAPSMRVADNEVRYASSSVLAAGRWVKIRVADNGIHMFTHAQLQSMGFENPDSVRLYGYGGHLLSESDIDTWRDDLREVPLWREADRVLFYANGPVAWKLKTGSMFTHTRNPYSEFGYYFLTEDAEAPMEFPVAESVGLSVDTISTTPAYTLHEVDDYAWIHGGRRLVESYDYVNGRLRSYSLPTYGVSQQPNGMLEVCFSHNASEVTTLSVIAGGNEVGTLRLGAIETNCEAAFATSSYAVVSLFKDSDKLDVLLRHNSPNNVSGHLDYLCLNYSRNIGLNMPIYATSTKADVYTYEVSADSPNKNTIVWCVTDAASPHRIPSALKEDKLYFSAKGSRGDVYVAFDPQATYPTPEVVGEVANQNLHATAATDYVIIVPANGKYTIQAERLAEAHRQRRGLKVKVVRADEIFNEFSSGTPDATAFRRYMKMLYDRAETVEDAPKYLLLFGDGSWDNRMLTSAWKGKSPDDYLLCYEAENSYSTTASHVVEDYFGFLDDGEGVNLKRDKVDLGVGRFPVTMVSQAREMVEKIIAYMENVEAGAWKNTILMLGDDGDENRHMADAEQVAQMLESEYPAYMVRRVYWDAYPMVRKSTGNTYPAVYKHLLELFKEGALMVNYSGHGAHDVLSHELVLSRTDMSQLRSPRLPLWVTVSCDITPFDNSVQSFGEAAFLNSTGGAIGLLTSTRTTFAEQNRRINYFFSKYAFAHDENNRRLSLGDALRMAKCSLITTGDQALRDISGNKLNYVLIGDPALIVGNTDYRVVVDSLNDLPIESGGDVLLKAGAEVKVKGHVDGVDGMLATNFSGMLYTSVFDNIEEIVCRNNANAKGLTPFVYHERTKKIFVGSDSVRNGEFVFTFRVPLDINYSQESGLINMYAIDSTLVCEAKGTYDSFLLGGTEDDLNDDGLGPNIQLYLNSSDFVSGGKVNETPRLVVTLEDADGINTAGNLGHDLVAIIDGKPAMTYYLNEYYTSDIGTYTRGSISYLLPELPEGKHTLTFRAWDMMNNSSTVSVEFEVVKGLSPNIVQVITMPNPADDHMVFMLTHDRPENEVVMTFEVFDFSGRTLWKHSEWVVSPDNTYSYTWDLRATSGQRLSSGVYLCRITASSLSGKSESLTRKILIRHK